LPRFHGKEAVVVTYFNLHILAKHMKRTTTGFIISTKYTGCVLAIYGTSYEFFSFFLNTDKISWQILEISQKHIPSSSIVVVSAPSFLDNFYW